MTCGFGNVVLYFTELGIKVQPYELDLRIERDKFDHCRCEISKQAGKLIADETSGNPNQPVDIYIDGNRVLRRMYMPEGALEYDNNNRDAYLKLMDPLHLLKQGKMDKKFKEVTLEDAISYVMDKVRDPNNVIQEWDITDPEYSDDYPPSYEEYRDESLFASASDYIEDRTGSHSVVLERTSDFVRWGNGHIENATGIGYDIGELDFNKVSPYEAMMIIASEWELDVWVDDVRCLLVGKRETRPNTHIVNANSDTLNVAEYNVTEAAFPVAEVIVKGGKLTPYGSQFTQDGSMDVQQWGQARIDNIENGRTFFIDNKKLGSGDALQRAAEQRLISEMSKNKSGNIVFNPAVSGFTEFSQPHTVTVGDMMMVQDPPEECNNFDEDGGNFVVNSVNHKIRGGRGWELTVEVGVVPKDGVRSQYILYDLNNDEVVEYGEEDGELPMFIV